MLCKLHYNIHDITTNTANTSYTRAPPIELNNNQILENNIGKFEGFQSKGYIDPNEFDNQNYSMFDKSFENYLHKKNNTYKLDDDFDPFQM